MNRIHVNENKQTKNRLLFVPDNPTIVDSHLQAHFHYPAGRTLVQLSLVGVQWRR